MRHPERLTGWSLCRGKLPWERNRSAARPGAPRSKRNVREDLQFRQRLRAAFGLCEVGRQYPGHVPAGTLASDFEWRGLPPQRMARKSLGGSDHRTEGTMRRRLALGLLVALAFTAFAPPLPEARRSSGLHLTSATPTAPSSANLARATVAAGFSAAGRRRTRSNGRTPSPRAAIIAQWTISSRSARAAPTL